MYAPFESILGGSYDSVYNSQSCLDRSWSTVLQAYFPRIIAAVLSGTILNQLVLPYEARGPFLALVSFSLIHEVLLNLRTVRVIAFFWAVILWLGSIWLFAFLQDYLNVRPNREPDAFTATDNVYTANNAVELDALLAANHQAIVFFHALEWSQPCRDIAPLFAWLADEYSCPGYFALIQVNVTRALDLQSRYEIAELPTFITFEAGQPAQIEVQDLESAASVERGDATEGIEKIIGSLELDTLLKVVKAMSDDAWEMANDDAEQTAHAAPAQSFYKSINTTGEPNQSGIRNHRSPLTPLTPSPLFPDIFVNGRKLGPSKGGATNTTIDSASYSSDVEST